MLITEVRVLPVDPDRHNPNLLAFCSIVLDNVLLIRDLRLIRGTHGIFVAMPCRKLDEPFIDEDGRTRMHRDSVFPIEPGCRAMIHDAVVGEYKRLMEEMDVEREGLASAEKPPSSPAPPLQSSGLAARLASLRAGVY